MFQDIETHCKSYMRYIIAKLPRTKYRGLTESLVASRPLEILALDFIILDEEYRGYENAVILTNVCTGFVMAATLLILGQC